MSAAVGTFEWHLEQLGQHPCCWVVAAGDKYRQCGLYCGHSGEHLSYVPGEYLFMPRRLDPLAGLRLQLARFPWCPCPVCGRFVDGWDALWGVHSWEIAPGDVRSERGWLRSFVPCGCEAFEVAP